MATSMTMGRRGGGGVGGRIVGDYLIVRQIGSGSYSVVWLGRHRVLGTEVAVKEIPMDKLSKKLQESLLFEASVLKRISHPNIINFYDFVQGPGRIYHILEYCRGGDLSKYIQRHGKVPEATAKHFIRQLASGLQVLRDNNVVHRDLKPQNLLLTAHEEYSVLKIADFGLARSLQPRDLAETMCGSPLYMAPEVMQNQKYDTKADLWSAGVILFQLVTGKTPFDGNNQMQLLQNIVKSNELSFPVDNNLSQDCIDLCRKLLRRKPGMDFSVYKKNISLLMERITIEEFLNHQFLSEPILDGTFSRTLSDTRDGFPLIESSLARPSGESSQEDCMPFPLDDESSAQDQPMNRRSMRISYGFSLGTRSDKTPDFSPSKNVGLTSRYSSNNKKEGAGYKHDSFGGKPKEASISLEQAADSISRKDSVVSDSLEFVDQDYVIVSGPTPEISTSPVSAFRTRNSPCKSEGSPIRSPRFSAVSTPMEITGAPISRPRSIGSLGSHSSPASGTSQGSTDMGDHLDQPSAHFMTRIRSLQQYASVITELVKEEIANGTKLEAFSVQLVILAIWKQAMHICHAQAASAIGGSPSQEVKKREASGDASHSSTNSQLPDSVCTQIETDFLLEVDHAEELATDIGQIADATEMPDAIEIIFQCALTSGRHGAVDEMMGNAERAAIRYSKAICLLYFLLVEAPTLDLNPPFSLTNSDRYRIRQYIDVLKTRQRQLHPEKQRMSLKSHD